MEIINLSVSHPDGLVVLYVVGTQDIVAINELHKWEGYSVWYKGGLVLKLHGAMSFRVELKKRA
jgi:hypothetical protein